MQTAMHVVLWTSADQRYATPTSAIVEVIPVVAVRPLPHTEPWVRGLFNYRGSLLPLLDAAQLLGQGPADIRMFGRILVMDTREMPDEQLGAAATLGLIVQQVIGSDDLDLEDASAYPEPDPQTSTVSFLGPVALTSGGTVQLIEPSRMPVPELGQPPESAAPGKPEETS
jgi:chemotaxis-related protein WspB